ncbi:MAG: hypothetical protein U0835_11160 [Isosphaeraceae bacterium]
MSKPTRIALGLAFLACAAGFLVLVPFFQAAGNDRAVVGLPVLAVFCGVGAMACFSAASRPVTIRALAGAVLAVYVWYVFDQLGRPVRLPKLGRPGLVNSVVGLVVFGVPASYTLVMGRFPSWWPGARAFGTGRPEVRKAGLKHQAGRTGRSPHDRRKPPNA